MFVSSGAAIALPTILSQVDPEVRALRSAAGRVLNWWPDLDETEALVGRGWTAEAVEQIEDMILFAVQEQTAIARMRNKWHPDQSLVGEYVADWTLAAVAAGRSPEFLLGWLRLLVAAPEAALVEEVGDVLNRGGLGLMGWLRLAGPERGPLAFAAGLSKREVKDLKKARSLTVEGLETLLGLRGFRFPTAP